jgi:hypothetical protein
MFEERPVSSIASFLDTARRRGVRLWAVNGEVRYQAPKGALTSHDIELLKAHRAEVLVLLAPSAHSSLTRREELLGLAPLSYSQQAHWQLYRLDKRPSIRQLTLPLRLTGPLQISALEQALVATIAHHDALRTQVIICDGVPMQQVSDSVRSGLKRFDLRACDRHEKGAFVQTHIEEQILEPVAVNVDPLLAMRILQLDEAEHVLILSVDHMISDLYSLAILRGDILRAYAQACQRQAICLAPVPLQLPDFARMQRAREDDWREAHSAHWREHLKGARAEFPQELIGSGQQIGWGVFTQTINPAILERLREWSRHHRTTIVMGALTAYAALVMRWCKANECIIQFQMDGRTSERLGRTIGYLSAPLYLRLAGDGVRELLRQVMDEFCRALEHADGGLLGTQVPKPEFTRSPAFNWLPPYTTTAEEDAPELHLSVSPVHFTHPMGRVMDIDADPSMVLFQCGIRHGGSPSRGCGASRKTTLRSLMRWLREATSL